MNDDDMKNQEQSKDEKKIVETYDVLGLFIGGGVGLLFSFTGIINFLMSLIIGMFLGLLIGTFVKK